MSNKDEVIESSGTATTEKAVTQVKQKTAKPAPKSKNPYEDYQKYIKARFSGETIILTGAQIMWGYEGFTMNGIPGDGETNSQKLVPKDASLHLLDAINKAEQGGVLALLKERKDLVDVHKNASVQSINDTASRDNLTEVDELIHKSVDGLKKSLERLQKEGTGEDFFKLVLQEETTRKNRAEYVSTIEAFI